MNLPQENISALVEFAKEQGESSGLKVLCYAHVGSGGLHIHTAYDGTKEDFIPLMAAFAAQVYARCAQLSAASWESTAWVMPRLTIISSP